MPQMQEDAGYLIVGKNGFVAKALIEHLVAKGKKIAVTTRSTPVSANEFTLDLNGDDGIPADVLTTYRNVVFLAAISSPDICSQQYDFAYSCNVTGTARFIRRCLSANARVLFFSSDTVYGPTTAPVDETVSPRPIGEYALMKRQIEEIFEGEQGFRAARMSYVVSSKDKFTSYLTACSASGKHAEIFHPFIRSPIGLRDVVEFVPLLFENWSELGSKVINLAGPDELSRLDMAKLYQRAVNSRLQFSIVTPAAEFFAARPQKIVLDARYLEQVTGHKCASIEQALKMEFTHV